MGFDESSSGNAILKRWGGEDENWQRKKGRFLYLRTSEVVFLLDFAKLFDISDGLLAYEIFPQKSML